jgi:hypothetical protein
VLISWVCARVVHWLRNYRHNLRAFQVIFWIRKQLTNVLGVRVLQMSYLDVWNAKFKIYLGKTSWNFSSRIWSGSNFCNILNFRNWTKIKMNKILTWLTFSKVIYVCNIYIFYTNFIYMNFAFMVLWCCRQSCRIYSSTAYLVSKYIYTCWWSVLIETCTEFLKCIN